MNKTTVFTSLAMLLSVVQYGFSAERLERLGEGEVQENVIASTSDHNFRIMNKYLQLIRSGEKTVEGRLNSEDYQRIIVGHTIRFFSDNDELMVRVKRLNSYKTFRAMLESEGLGNMLPGMTSINEGVELYRSFPGYRDNELKYGALAIAIGIIDRAFICEE